MYLIRYRKHERLKRLHICNLIIIIWLCYCDPLRSLVPNHLSIVVALVRGYFDSLFITYHSE